MIEETITLAINVVIIYVNLRVAHKTGILQKIVDSLRLGPGISANQHTDYKGE
jgi:hypothetical protein